MQHFIGKQKKNKQHQHMMMLFVITIRGSGDEALISLLLMDITDRYKKENPLKTPD